MKEFNSFFSFNFSVFEIEKLFNLSVFEIKKVFILYNICLWIPQIVLNSANTAADSTISPIFGAILSGTNF